MNKFKKENVIKVNKNIGVIHNVITLEPAKWDKEGQTRYQYCIFYHHGGHGTHEEEEIELHDCPNIANTVLNSYKKKVKIKKIIYIIKIFIIFLIQKHIN